jgi:hypothetical protein
MKRRYRRAELCVELRQLGFPITMAKLNKLCAPSENKGPPSIHGGDLDLSTRSMLALPGPKRCFGRTVRRCRRPPSPPPKNHKAHPSATWSGPYRPCRRANLSEPPSPVNRGMRTPDPGPRSAGPCCSAWLEPRPDGLFSLRCNCSKTDRQPLYRRAAA